MAWWLDLTFEFLPLKEAYASGEVCLSWLERQEALDSKARLGELRLVLAESLKLLEMDEAQCRRLLREWHECLKHCILQVAYVTYDQHLIYVEPRSSVARAPSEPFLVDTDAATYRCLIKALTTEAMWWDCLENLSCEGLPGYDGDLTRPKLPEDLQAVLALNCAWFHHGIRASWSRELHGILLLRDGRFLLIRSLEAQNILRSRAKYRCFLAKSLKDLVTFQDAASREVLGTVAESEAVPEEEDLDFEACEEFQHFHFSDSDAGETLYNSEIKGSSKLQVGDLCRVQRTGDTFIWQSCSSDGWGLPDGPVPPHVEKGCLQHASCQDRRFLSFSKACHLGLRREVCYTARVLGIVEGKAHVVYTEPVEWSDGASGFTSGLGGSLKEPLLETDVELKRILPLPDSKWYWSFWRTWERNTSKSPVHETGDYLKLADALQDSENAHVFRVELLSREREHLDELEEIASLEEDLKHREGPWPRQAMMGLGKRLFLKLLRSSYWKTWVSQGGESPAKIATVFGKKKFVRLVLR